MSASRPNFELQLTKAWRSQSGRRARQVESDAGVHRISAGQAIIVKRGEWVRYSTSSPQGPEYVAVCLPAFSPAIVHRDSADPSRGLC
jgi:hypothetical protein